MKYFGTDGFRGQANEGLNVDHAFKIGRFVGWYYGLRQERKARVVLDEVRDAVRAWPRFAAEAEVREDFAAQIATRLAER